MGKAAMNSERIWLHPPKFWARTKEMSKDQVDELMIRIWQMAEERDLQGLRQFDFIFIGDPRATNRAKAS